MKKLLILMAFWLMCSVMAQGEEKNYSPAGEVLDAGNGSVNAIMAKYFPGVLSYTYFGEFTESGVDVVVFKLFTDEPLFIVTSNPENISSAVESFDLNEFLHSYQLGAEIKSNIEKGISDIFLLETLGAPTDVVRTSDGTTSTERWYYEPYDITLYLTDGLVFQYIEF